MKLRKIAGEGLCALAPWLGCLTASGAATPGLPFSENFSDTLLRDATHTTANWRETEGVVTLATGRPSPYLSGLFPVPIDGLPNRPTRSVALGDIDADGDLDLVSASGNALRLVQRNDGSGGVVFIALLSIWFAAAGLGSTRRRGVG